MNWRNLNYPVLQGAAKKRGGSENKLPSSMSKLFWQCWEAKHSSPCLSVCLTVCRSLQTRLQFSYAKSRDSWPCSCGFATLFFFLHSNRSSTSISSSNKSQWQWHEPEQCARWVGGLCQLVVVLLLQYTGRWPHLMTATKCALPCPPLQYILYCFRTLARAAQIQLPLNDRSCLCCCWWMRVLYFTHSLPHTLLAIYNR